MRITYLLGVEQKLDNILVGGRTEVRSLIALEANILMTPRGLPSLLIKGGGESLMRHPLVGAAFFIPLSFEL